MVSLIEAKTAAELETALDLVLEYGKSLDGHVCAARFEKTVGEIRANYDPPAGCFILALWEGMAAGCIALARIDDDTCEMRRLFVRPNFRGLGIGRLLVEVAIGRAEATGYATMRLDTLSTLERAKKLYESLGFRYIEPYSEPIAENQLFMERELQHSGQQAAGSEQHSGQRAADSGQRLTINE